MSVPAKLASFAVVLAACFALGLGIGAAVGPIDDGATPPTRTHTTATTAPMDMDHDVVTTGHDVVTAGHDVVMTR